MVEASTVWEHKRIRIRVRMNALRDGIRPKQPDKKWQEGSRIHVVKLKESTLLILAQTMKLLSDNLVQNWYWLSLLQILRRTGSECICVPFAMLEVATQPLPFWAEIHHSE